MYMYVQYIIFFVTHNMCFISQSMIIIVYCMNIINRHSIHSLHRVQVLHVQRLLLAYLRSHQVPQLGQEFLQVQLIFIHILCSDYVVLYFNICFVAKPKPSTGLSTKTTSVAKTTTTKPSTSSLCSLININ